MSELFKKNKFQRQTENEILRGSNPDPKDTNPSPKMGDLVKHRVIAALVEAINIVGGTITGATIRTSESGQRVEMISMGPYDNMISLYGTDGNVIGLIGTVGTGEMFIRALKVGAGNGLALVIGDFEAMKVQDTAPGSPFITSRTITPYPGVSANLGSSGNRWANIYGTNIYCANQTADNFTTGDLLFKDLYRIDEDKDYLNFYNNKTDKLIMKLGQDGTVYAKDFKKL